MGTVTNKIQASVLGFRKVEEVTPLIKSDNSVTIVASPSYDGTLVLLKKNDDNVPADYSGTFECVVTGRA